MGELHRGHSDTAGGATHEQAVAGGEAALGEQHVVRGREDLGEAAGLQASDLGGRERGALWTMQYSACAPPPTTAMTRSPIAKPSTSGPVATTIPASSIPRMSGDPGGGG